MQLDCDIVCGVLDLVNTLEIEECLVYCCCLAVVSLHLGYKYVSLKDGQGGKSK
jgi:hypothetical protein